MKILDKFDYIKFFLMFVESRKEKIKRLVLNIRFEKMLS